MISQKAKGYLLLESSQPRTGFVKDFKNFSLGFVFSHVIKCLGSKLLTQCAHLIFPVNIVWSLNICFLLLVFHFYSWKRKHRISNGNIFRIKKFHINNPRKGKLFSNQKWSIFKWESCFRSTHPWSYKGVKEFTSAILEKTNYFPTRKDRFEASLNGRVV